MSSKGKEYVIIGEPRFRAELEIEMRGRVGDPHYSIDKHFL